MAKKEKQPWHYYVISERPLTRYGYIGGTEPPEDYYPYGEVKALNKREALMEAVKLPDFRDWVSEQRGDNKPPWYELRAELLQCEHGTCWGCNDECQKCIDAYDDLDGIDQ